MSVFLLLLTLFGSPAPLPNPVSISDDPVYDTALLEQLVLEAVNETRQARGRIALRSVPALDALARGHSEDLTRTGDIGHLGSDGRRPIDRATRAGLRPARFAENVFAGPLFAYLSLSRTAEGAVSEWIEWETPERLARLAVEGWMDSPGHRRNMLDGRFRTIGVGVALDDYRGWIVTINLSAP